MNAGCSLNSLLNQGIGEISLNWLVWPGVCVTCDKFSLLTSPVLFGLSVFPIHPNKAGINITNIHGGR
ncbi:MAG: hypothetical protein COV98_03260 [Candidatus Altarchaeum sp. CG12_big_fil_rev_8_21_14_0_65_33_22]|nr:MAG: hypothetical protein COV98_03260 [Candidatus Altarchaeum sp. CG12_big_fil_rev_8_21_14_0_65_33_22]PIV28886.1 MAG: hypothetical protein COS36_00725 [Candidatus Altarchaeum sp. CG03_land_8_20_14_0_80_32_618]PIZ31223.1 MAG: hypothetical protein COY41_02870 [Candidatus Altarchaeum sp. CG_4_10_14_0_8_um_filter_32_851]PJC14806.1 MAG: hypothetical protein CO063_02255 [Candidatus Altarchaeum sp. CG_4_9_14_0_8_um_filter_32_206]